MLAAIAPTDATVVVAGISAVASIVGAWLTTRNAAASRATAAASRATLDELRPNHGSPSTRELVERTAVVVDRMDARLNRQEDRSDRHGAELVKVGRSMDAIGARLLKGDERFERIEQRLAEQGPQQITIVGTQPTPPDQEDPS